MFEFMIYPVSAIMKFWHFLLASVFGVDPGTAWLLSIVGLVVTVRLIILPTVWIQMVSGRKGQLLQPKLGAIQEQYEARTDADAFKWLQEERKKIHQEHKYNPAAGCFPIFIQLPMFIGLYQVLLRMARPSEGLDTEHKAIGFLSPQDVAEFLQVRFLDVPLPAYIAMSDERLAQLGTTRDLVVGVNSALVLAACAFTAINMAFSTWRSYRTMQWDSAVARVLNRMLATFVVFVPIMLLLSAFTAPLPLAIMLYWFGGNLWSLVQFTLLTWLLERKMPLTEEFKARRDAAKAAYKLRKKEHRALGWQIKKLRLKSLFQPQKWSEHSQTIKDMKAEATAEQQEAKRVKKDNARLRREATKARREAKKQGQIE